MRYRPLGSDPADSRLGRYVSDTTEHLEKWPLTAATVPETPVPVCIGVNWYSDFDNPVKKGRYHYIGLEPRNLGHIRGGHSVVIEAGDQLGAEGQVVRKLQDLPQWYHFYDQGREGACVGFAASRMMSMLNRRAYFARWLWDWSKATDRWVETNPGDDEGTSVHAAMDILRTGGHVPWKKAYESLQANAAYTERDNLAPLADHGVNHVRWITQADDLLQALKSPDAERTGTVRILNSWGTNYPQRVRMPLETVQRLMDEHGEFAVVTDR